MIWKTATKETADRNTSSYIDEYNTLEIESDYSEEFSRFNDNTNLVDLTKQNKNQEIKTLITIFYLFFS